MPPSPVQLPPPPLQPFRVSRAKQKTDEPDLPIPVHIRRSRSLPSRMAANEVPTTTLMSPLPVLPPVLPLLRRSPRLALLPGVSYVGMC